MKHLIFIFFWGVGISLNAQNRIWGQWEQWGEQPDGMYMNPVIPSDYSDIDCIRVGEDYYAISSTMQFSPGMTILHSKDLVNWTICGNAVTDLTQIGPELNWNRMNRYGKGVWAGTLRHHNNRFYLFFGTPDEGYFMTSAPKAEGPWEPLVTLMSEKGWDDCTAIWDEKGQGWFAGTHFADGYKTYLFPMSKDGRSIDRSKAKLINSGNHREASKLIKVDGWYYLVFSEHKHGIGRYVMAKRSRKINGPYREERQLAHVNREAMEPNQGGIVLGKNKRWYFFTHHGSGDWSGRITSLLPVTWIDGWPLIGQVNGTEPGTMVWSDKMPTQVKEKPTIQRSDDFDTPQLSPQWQWNYQPRNDFFSLTERPGWMRLKAFRTLKPNDLMKAGNTLTQRTFRKSSNEVTVKLDISHMENGQRNGLCHFSSQHSAIGVVMENDTCRLEYRKNGVCTKGYTITTTYIWLRSEWGLDGMSSYSYSLDGDTFHSYGEPYQMVWGHYRGDRIGIYCFNDTGEHGFVDVDYLHYR